MFDFLKGSRPYFMRFLFFYVLLAVCFCLLTVYFWFIRDSPPFVRDASLAISSAIIGSFLYDAFKKTHDIFTKPDNSD